MNSWIPPDSPVRGASPPTSDEIFRLRSVAGGGAPGDIAIRNGRVVFVHSGEVREADLIISGRHIAAVVDPGRLKALEEIDVAGKYIAPTFIDSHLHIEYTMMTPAELARLVIPKGTTAVFTDPDCVANVLGEEGIDYMRETTTPLRIFQQVTSDVPRRGTLNVTKHRISQEEILRRLGEPDTVSLGESNPFMLDPEIAEAMATAIGNGKIITGHAGRLAGEPLWGYIAGGVGNDHNAANLDEVLELVRHGMIVTIMSGSLANNVRAILGEPEKLGLVVNHLAFCADDVHVEDLADKGHIDRHVREAVSLGMDPATSIRMGSLNAAAHFRVDHLIGSITPSRLADFQILSDLESFEPESVWANGHEVARDGKALFENTDEVPHWALESMSLGEIDPKALAVAAADPSAGLCWVQAMEMYNDYFKRAFHIQLPVVDGFVQTDPDLDIAKFAVVDRHHGSGKVGIGFVHGFGLRSGAIAAAHNCDSGSAIAVATSDEDLVHVLRVLQEERGGFVCVDSGEVRALVQLPVGGLMGDVPWETTYEQSKRIHAVVKELGCPIANPFMILPFVGMAFLPDLGVTENGLVDVYKAALTDLVLKEEDGKVATQVEKSERRTREQMLEALQA